MLSVRLDPDIERLLEHDVDDLARYNILRYLHDRPDTKGDVDHFADQLGLRSPERTAEALEALVRCGLLVKEAEGGSSPCRYTMSADLDKVDLVERLFRLSSSSLYGEIIDRLAARSLHRARHARSAPPGERSNGHKKP